ncbi:MAG: cyclase family protein [Clostridia bacterium]|jgi:kynurenine formamidase|nr:cyclase family protein [Clostridia bacterium]
MFKIVDLSLAHENGGTEPFPPKIEFSDHTAGAHRLAKLAGVEAADFPESMALATDIISGSGHSGTHIDAPLHYGPLCEGKPAKSVDQVPLEWCFGPAVVLDMRHKEPGAEITAADIQEALEKIGYEIKPGDIVIFHTGCDKYWGTDTATYLKMQSGLGVAGLDWLLDRGVRCIGIDAWTLDRPVNAMVEAYRKTGDKNELWGTHMHGRQREYIQIEKLANLEKLPQPYGFILSALPVKLAGATAGWCRAVALIGE